MGMPIPAHGRALTLIAVVVAAVAVLPPVAASAVGTPSVSAGAQIPAGTFTFVGNMTTACTHHVAVTGSDGNSGTSLGVAWRTPAKAMATLQAGQTACVHAGTYDTGTLSPARSGTATAPIALIGAPGEVRPVLRGTTDATLLSFEPRDAYWVVQGVELDKNRHDGPGVQVLGSPSSGSDPTAGPAHHIAIRGSVIRDGKSGAAVLIRHAATDVLIEGNQIFGHHRWVNGSTVAHTRVNTDFLRDDANAVNLEGTATGEVARVELRGNHLHDNGGDGVQCLGVHDDTGAHSRDPADLDAVDNRVDHNTEDAIDIKSCQRVSIRGSRSPALAGPAADNKLFGYRPTDRTADLPGNHSGGGAIVIHYFARGVLVENTRIWDACRGIGVGRDDKNSVQDVVIRRVLIFGLLRTGSDCPGIGINLVLAQRVDLYHNTLTGIPGLGLRLASDNGGSWSSTDVDIFNNIIETTGTGHWIDAYRARLSGLQSDRNLFWNADASTSHLLLDFTQVSLAGWRTSTGQDTTSGHGNPQWIANPATNDYYTVTGSPARDTALPTPTSFCGAGPDIGFRESDC